ncbi:MAG: GTP-binding protein, partial [Clostridiaceae bacterium]|nr:GTP-binding protein [Clostridiaceae bacterium]
RADSYEQGRILREGLTVVLAGQPNAGKSSLLNALAGYERAIVTAIPGTTRDTVEERVDIRGIPVRLIDTAGLRETHDPIEQLGVARTRQALRQADLVFWLLSPPLDDVDAELKQMRQSGCEHLVPLVSKEDLAASAELVARIRSSRPSGPLLTCSVLTGEGIEQIRDEIVRVYESRGAAQAQDVLVSNSRQRVCLEKASEQLEAAQEALTSGLTLDVVASLLRGALDALAELTGENVSEELIDTIFSRFCVGK